MRPRTIIIAIVVVISLIVGYWAFIGFRTSVPDFKNNSNTNANTGPYGSYGTFRMVVSFPGGVETPIANKIVITPMIEDYHGPSTGMVYEQTPGLQADQGTGSGGGASFDIRVTAMITGPNGYSSNWLSSSQTVIGFFSGVLTFNSGRALFSDIGTYTISVTQSATLSGVADPAPPHSGSFTTTFVVSK